MDVELSRPEPFSFDTLVALLALALVGWGGYRVFTQVGTSAGSTGWVLIAAGWVLVFPRLFLDLELTRDAFQVNVVTGTRRIGLDEVTGVGVAEGRLTVHWLGVSASGYHAGNFRLTGVGDVKAYASRVAGTFVVLERDRGRPVALTPADPDAFVDAVADRRQA